MKHLVMLLSFFCLVSFSMAQRQISGTVLEKSTKNPIPNAQVSVGSEKVSVQQDGTFLIGNVPENGKVTRTVSAPGYKSEIINVRTFTG